MDCPSTGCKTSWGQYCETGLQVSTTRQNESYSLVLKSLKLNLNKMRATFTANDQFTLPWSFFPVSAIVLICLTGTDNCSFHLHTSYIKIHVCQTSTAISSHPRSDVSVPSKCGDLKLMITYGKKWLKKYCKNLAKIYKYSRKWCCWRRDRSFL